MKTLERIATFVAYIVLFPLLLVDIPKTMWEWRSWKMSVAVWCVRAWLHSVKDIVRY